MAAFNNIKKRKEQLGKMASGELSDHALATRTTIDSTVHRSPSDSKGLLTAED
jgi:hypothetical protein